jgi:hypothetical protein
MDYLVKQIWFVASIFASVVCALLGLTAGINLNPAATVHFVPNWGSVGDWVSGIGALLAVAVALWQVHRQQEREKPRIVMHHDLRTSGLALGVVSEGHAPVTILGAHLVHDQTSTIDFADRLPEKCVFPMRLDRGEVMHFLNLNQIGTALLGKELIQPRLETMQAQGKQSVIYAKSVDEDYFSQLNTILNSKAKIIVRTPNTLEELEIPGELYSYLLRQALEDTRRQAMERVETQRREALELVAMFEAHRTKTESQADPI